MPEQLSIDELEATGFIVTPEMVDSTTEELSNVFAKLAAEGDERAIYITNRPKKEFESYIRFICQLKCIYNRLLAIANAGSLKAVEMIEYEKGKFKKSLAYAHPLIFSHYLEYLNYNNQLSEEQVTFFQRLCECIITPPPKGGAIEAIGLIRSNTELCGSVLKEMESGYFHPHLIIVACRQLGETDIFANAISQPLYNLMRNYRDFLIVDNSEEG